MTAIATWMSAALVALLAVGAARSTSGAVRPGAAKSDAAARILRVSPQAAELKGRPALVHRLRETPAGYFRFVSRPFNHAVCTELRSIRSDFPDVNVHGDSHLEQYAITSLGRGLTDFDESGRGPAFIDLVRFGVSVELAAREKRWPGEGVRAFNVFLAGYREALKHPNINHTVPQVVSRARDGFTRDHQLALRRADALIDGDPVAAAYLAASARHYAARMLTPGMPATFFKIKKAGRSSLGIGSAPDEKYILRIEGSSDAADDDRILEAKLVRPLSNADCVHGAGGAVRVPQAMALIAYAPFQLSGLAEYHGRTFWIHEWTDDYVELSIAASFLSAEDLRQVAYDVGVQLGWAHPKNSNGRHVDLGFRDVLLQSTFAHENRLRETVSHLADATVAAWMAFREATTLPLTSQRFRSFR